MRLDIQNCRAKDARLLMADLDGHRSFRGWVCSLSEGDAAYPVREATVRFPDGDRAAVPGAGIRIPDGIWATLAQEDRMLPNEDASVSLDMADRRMVLDLAGRERHAAVNAGGFRLDLYECLGSAGGNGLFASLRDAERATDWLRDILWEGSAYGPCSVGVLYGGREHVLRDGFRDAPDLAALLDGLERMPAEDNLIWRDGVRIAVDAFEFAVVADLGPGSCAA